MKRKEFETWVRENAVEFEVTRTKPATLRYRVTIDFQGELPVKEE